MAGDAVEETNGREQRVDRETPGDGPNWRAAVQLAVPTGKHRGSGTHSSPTATGVPVACESSQMTLKLAPFRTDPIHEGS